MTPGCVDRNELQQLLDGELTENRAAWARDHVEACSPCARALAVQRRLVADLAAPVAEPATARLVASVIDRLDEAPVRHRASWPLLASVAVAGAAAALLVTVKPRGRSDDSAADPGFHARGGGGGDALARRVAVELFVIGPPARKLTGTERVAGDARYVAAYRNLARHSSAYLLAFAVDAAGTVHWLYPAYLDGTTDPAAIELGQASHSTALPDMAVLDHPALGPMRLVTIVAAQRERVSAIERLSAAQLERGALEARFPGAIIDEIGVEIAAAQDGARP